MLRVAIPYGLVSSPQLRTLAQIARQYDRGYGHFTTRQNIQFNWPTLESVPDILALLATVEMHAIQTSGNCVRNTTSDPLAGVAADEIVDPRPWCELIRQWSTLHPEFAFLPRKFKIAVTGATVDRTAALVHDIGAQAVRNAQGETGFRVLVGGGQGRTPMIGYAIREFLPAAELLNYFDAILRIYNLHGRRDNKYKARIKILVKELTQAEFTRQVEAEWEHLRGGPGTVPDAEIARLAACFVDPPYREFERDSVAYRAAIADSRPFSRWAERNVKRHKRKGYAIVTLSLKRTGSPPGDVTADELDAIAAPGRALQLRRGPDHARAEPRARRRAAKRPPRPLGALAGAWVSRRRTSASSPTSSAARAGTSARSPTPSPSRSRRPSSAASTISTICTISVTSNSTCRVA